MKTTILLSAVALAVFVAAPAVAKSRTQHHAALVPAQSNSAIIQFGKVLGTDPDPNVRFAIMRDNKYWLEE
jgi:hypothetical protein